MPVFFANPLGLLALLGIPVVLAIHFLHRHRRAIPVSTMFLIEIAREPARSGRRWHRLIPSVPMWLQLLLVILLATLLSRPFLPRDALQVAVVVDESASMRVFRAELAEKLTDLHAATRRGRRGTHWTVLSANPTRPRLYSGENPAEWIANLANWSPADGWLDPATALRVARGRVGPGGLVVYATDTPREDLPGGAALLSVGHPIDNAGIGGVTVAQSDDGELRWQAVLVNPSANPATREWTLEWDGNPPTAPQPVTIPANGMANLSGALPPDAVRLVLRLDGDAFALDDAFPFVRPEPKPLSMATLGEGVPEWLPERMQRSIPRLSRAPAATADFVLAGVAEGGEPPPLPGIVFSTAAESGADTRGGPVFPASHPLVSGPAWAGLSVRDVPAPPPEPGDVPLLFAGDRPLASLREGGGDGPQLVLHFNPALSNLDRIPAGAVLLLRFAETIRAAKAATAWKQLEPGQQLTPFLTQTAGTALVMETLASDGFVETTRPITAAVRAPDEPGFIRIRDEEMVWIEAAVAFADARESDFRHRAAADTTGAAIANASRMTTRGREHDDHPARPLLVLAALAALLALYHFSTAPERGGAPQPT